MPINLSLKIPFLDARRRHCLNHSGGSFPLVFLFFSVFFLSFLSFKAKAQTADSLFKAGQNLAFAGKYDTAITLISRACSENPRDMDWRLALARVYAWQKNYDFAARTAHIVLQNQPQNREAMQALADIYLWSKNYAALETTVKNALKPANTGKKITDSLDFIKRLANGLIEQEDYKAAQQLLAPVSDSLQPQWQQVQQRLQNNRLTAHYTFFDFKNNQTDWHTLEIDYQKTMRRLTLIASLNSASRFGRQGLQYMVQAYPKIGNRAYAWLLAGYSNGAAFPNWVYGGSFFVGLPKGFEAELGVRFFEAGNEKASMVRAGLTYQKNANWFAYNLALIRSTAANGASHTVSYRRYFQRESYVQLSVGTGSSLTSNLALPLDNFIINNNAAYLQLNYWVHAQWRVLAGAGFERNKFNEKWQNRALFNLGLSYQW